MAKTNNCLNRLKDKNPLILLLFLVVFLLLVVCPLACFFSFIAFYLSWIPGIAIPLCTIAFLLLFLYGFAIKTKRQRVWKIAKNIIILPWCFWASVFIFGFLSWFFSNTVGLSMVSSKARFPLSNIRQIAVDSRGHIYCLSRTYNRIQVFDREGHFINGWFVDSGGKYYRLLIDENDNLQVATKRNATISFFNISGEQVNQSVISDYNKEFGLEMPTEVNDLLGDTYKIKGNELRPGVIKKIRSGEETTLIKDPFGLWIISPFLGLLCLVATSFIFLSMSIFLVKKKQ